MFSFKNFSSAKKSLWFRSWQPFFSLPIYGKFIIVLISFLAGYILIGFTSFYYTSHIKNGLTNFEDKYIEKYQADTSLQQSLQELQLQITALTESSRPLNLRDQQDLSRQIGDIEEILDRIAEENISSKDTLLVRKIHTAFQNLVSRLQDTMLSEAALGDTEILSLSARKEMAGDLNRLLSLVSDNINILIENQKASIQDLIQETNRHFRNNGMLVAALIIILSITSLLCINLLVKLLREMKEQLDALRNSEDDFSAASSSDLIPVISNDEIGAVAESANELIIDIKSLGQFRRTIEADETVEEVYRRLAGIFKHRLNLETFILWEISENEGSIYPVYIWPREMEDFLCPLSGSDMCRAKRLDETVSSASYPGICPVFPEPEAMTHTCIPLTVSGTTLGVAQFLFKYVDREERTEYMRKSLYSARRYLREALPVLHAKRLAQNLHEMATKDTLTGLYNRRFLEGNLSTLTSGIKRRKSQLGILMCDMDYFKQVNDEYGHEAGDTILVSLAAILQNSVREADLVIRYGGEEFLILLFECNENDAVKVAEKVKSTVEAKQFRIGGNSIRKTVSIGVSMYPSDTSAFWEAVKYSDVALYQAKEKGRNRILRFSRDMWEGTAY